MKTALLILDMLSEFDFPNGATLKRAAEEVAADIARLASRARKAKVPVIYVNDTSGKWESDQRAFLARCLSGRGAAIAQRLRPVDGDYFMFKPKHSAFYGTPLAFLLEELEVDSLILAGISADICISATAQDAYVRKYRLWVPSDCVAADTEEHERQTLDHMARTMKADTRPSGVGGLGWDEVRVG